MHPGRAIDQARQPPTPPPPLLQTSPQLTLPGCSDNLGQSLLGQVQRGTRQVWEEQGRCLGPTPAHLASPPGFRPNPELTEALTTGFLRGCSGARGLGHHMEPHDSRSSNASSASSRSAWSLTLESTNPLLTWDTEASGDP